MYSINNPSNVQVAYCWTESKQNNNLSIVLMMVVLPPACWSRWHNAFLTRVMLTMQPAYTRLCMAHAASWARFHARLNGLSRPTWEERKEEKIGLSLYVLIWILLFTL